MSRGPAAAAEAAGILVAAREAVSPIAALPDSCRPEDADEGYAIADATAMALGWPVAGWKIGCTALEQQAMLGVRAPFAGRLFAPLVQQSPAIWSAGAFAMRGIEVEFAFSMARTLPPCAALYTPDEVADAVAMLHPAVEIVDSRFREWRQVGAYSLIADNGVNGAFVYGTGDPDWRRRDLSAHAATLDIDGRRVAEGTGARVLGNPLNALTWLADHLSARGIGLDAGCIVTTGTCLGIHFVEAGAEIEADFGELGGVSLRFTG